MASSRGPYAKGVAKRAEILRAALEVIARHGYRKTSTRELAAAAGLSEAGMLHYFGSKEKLFEEVLRARDEADAARFADENPVDGLQAVIRHNTTVPGLVELYSTFSAEAGDPDHTSHQFFVNRYATLRTRLADAIRTRQSEGTLTPDADPDTIATLLIALSDGLQVQSQYDLTTDPADAFHHLLQLLAAPARDS
ncbi:TetR/AcrR family transcriptional regulator [Kribbella sp.]|uniref:TetR/AcrR family transcriptional regulator n=1 Tax=Kribbella sp. TaxID=1871183 RepID=UPI002D37B00A|nr:TetR/AcrR family transcriptional regulator [Kribbella sp.]HZX05277.1 TetR/AcrR family transcriptional regulator [Kribbella sp.]